MNNLCVIYTWGLMECNAHAREQPCSLFHSFAAPGCLPSVWRPAVSSHNARLVCYSRLPPLPHARSYSRGSVNKLLMPKEKKLRLNVSILSIFLLSVICDFLRVPRVYSLIEKEINSGCWKLEAGWFVNLLLC